MATKKVLDRSIRKKKKKADESITRKVKKIKRENPEVSKEELRLIEESERMKYEALKETYKIDYLNPKELIVLDSFLRNRPRKEVMAELGLSQSGYYYILKTPEVQKKLQEELQQKYNDMKKSRKVLYVKIAEKALNILLNRLEKMEEEQAEKGWSWEKTKDVMDIAKQVINMMQDEDGTKRTNVNLSGEVEVESNVNLKADVTVDLNDENFRKGFGDLLISTHEDTGIIK